MGAQGPSWAVTYKGASWGGRDPLIPCLSSGCHSQSTPTLRYCSQRPVLRPRVPGEALPRSHGPEPLLSATSVPRIPGATLSPGMGAQMRSSPWRVLAGEDHLLTLPHP